MEFLFQKWAATLYLFHYVFPWNLRLPCTYVIMFPHEICGYPVLMSLCFPMKFAATLYLFHYVFPWNCCLKKQDTLILHVTVKIFEVFWSSHRLLKMSFTDWKLSIINFCGKCRDIRKDFVKYKSRGLSRA